MAIDSTKEGARLAEAGEGKKQWKLWGPYLSERQWGTVREDYGTSGNSWQEFKRDEARFRAYRWGEDGIAGISDDHQRLCFSVALWNGVDDYIKDRLFGLTNDEGNNGEDVKEYYYYLDNTPTHSYMKYLYKYPQGQFPYQQLLDENRNRRNSGRLMPEYELVNTNIFDGQKYFDVLVEYAKADTDDILVSITVTNRGPEKKPVTVIPTICFRNVWSWGTAPGEPKIEKPWLVKGTDGSGFLTIKGHEYALKDRWLYCEGAQEVVFTANDSNRKALGWDQQATGYSKDGIDRYVRGEAAAAATSAAESDTADDAKRLTKGAALYRLELAPGESKTVRLRLADAEMAAPFDQSFANAFQERQKEADEFYQQVCTNAGDPELCTIQRQAFAGMLWNKQLYYYIIKDWLDGDPGSPKPPESRMYGRNSNWEHLYSKDVLSMPDKWEYPWFASWDLAFHTTTLAMIDPDFAKKQLLFLVMEWYMHPSGLMPAYEWDFGNINPPVQAWAAWTVYERDKKLTGKKDLEFLKRIFEKLNMNFTWWTNKVDRQSNNIFEGGFLGLDNIRIIDQASCGGTLEQADGTAWMAMYCLYMLNLASELVNEGHVCYRDAVRKYFQHFLYISASINNIGGQGLWNDQENFYFDVVRQDNGSIEPLKVFSLVGLIPLLSIAKVDVQAVETGSFLDLEKTFYWFLKYRDDLTKHGDIYFYPSDTDKARDGDRFKLTLSLVSPEKMQLILQRVLDSGQFLSDYGIRSLSKMHEANPYYFKGREIRYEPAESSQKIMGGNSNWRGPIWFPINYLLIDALRKFHEYLGDQIQVQHAPLGSTQKTRMTLDKVADDLSQRLVSIFRRQNGKRPVYGGVDFFDKDPHDPVLFYEYFHGDNGAGIGASHQTGWTGLVANVIDEMQ